MSSLAQELETNTTYLSVIINTYKNKSFPNYLKDLRVAKAIQMLNADRGLLKYSNQGLAEVFGFKTSESFSKAFYKNTGVYPSKFIKELNSIKEGGHL
nr:helix-turn-helix domain-containing protein [Salegentibacter maritimus]